MNFNEALGNMVHQVAAGGAIRHLADLGYSISMIEAELDWPTSREKIAKTIFDYYVEKGIICLEDPSQKSQVNYHYEKSGSTPWKQELIRVQDPAPQEDIDYVLLDFGKQIYKDKTGFEAKLREAGLGPKDLEYVLELPWPLQPVWHQVDERMKRIQKIIFELRE